MPESITEFRIIFYNQDAKFHEGNTLSGSVKFIVQDTIAISRLEIRFKGLSKVLWHKAFERNLKKSNVPAFKLYDSEQYLNQKLNLLTSHPSSRLSRMDPLGSLVFYPQEYIFPFSVQLPHSLPPTFTGDYGEVKYMAIAEILYSDPTYPSSSDLSVQDSLDDEVGSFLKCWKEFVVEKIQHLTDEDLKPREASLTKRHNIMILKLSDIRCQWKLEKGGFLPGEDMHVLGNIENLGRIKVLKAKIAFIQHIVYKSQKSADNYIYQRKRLASKTKTCILPDACGYLREKIHVPVDAAPTNQSKGELINIRYSIKPSTCLVIGGCGFLGRHLVEKLLDMGHRVHVVDLRVTFTDDRVKFFNIDLCNVKDLLESMDGVETVFHCATPNPLGGHKKTFHTVNVVGTKHIIDSCLYKKVKNLVLVSSAFVVYTGVRVDNGTEELPYADHTSNKYLESKVIQEQLVLRADCDQLNTVALRPSSMFGPRDMNVLPNVARSAASSRGKFIIGNGQNAMDFVYVENVIQGIIMASNNLGPNSKLKGKAYNITNNEPILFWKFYEKLSTGLGYRPPKYHVSYHFVRMLASVENFLTGLLGRFAKVTPALNPFAVEISATHVCFSCGKAGRDFQYEPKVKLDDGIRMTLDACPTEYFSKEFLKERTLKMKE